MFSGNKNRNEGTLAKTALVRNRPCVSSRKFLAGKVFLQISTLLENSSPIFRQHDMPSLPRFGHFPARKMAVGNPARLQERSWIFSSETGTAFFSELYMSSCSEKQEMPETGPHLGRNHIGETGFRTYLRRWANGVARKWGWTDLTRFCFFSAVGVRLVPLKTHDFKGFRPDFNRIQWNI